MIEKIILALEALYGEATEADVNKLLAQLSSFATDEEIYSAAVALH